LPLQRLPDYARLAGCHPEKAPKVARPGTGRWLLFLAFVMLVGIALTLWCWTSERTGFVFWFTALGPFCTWGLFSAYAGLPTKPNRWGRVRNVEREALIDSEILRGQRCAWILGTYIQLRPETKPMTC
jgi:pheromone shutdown protein TraB